MIILFINFEVIMQYKRIELKVQLSMAKLYNLQVSFYQKFDKLWIRLETVLNFINFHNYCIFLLIGL
jgi:hypothetical protein